MTKRLPEKRRRFVEAYMGEAAGNATEAARIAGYASPEAEGCRLLKNAEVSAAIEQRVKSDPKVKTREQILRWWSDMMDNAEEDRDRIKASELLAKAQAMFVQRVEHTGKDGGPIQTEATVERAHLKNANPEQLEKLEAALQAQRDAMSEIDQTRH